MSRISIADLQDHTPRGVLDSGAYILEIGPETKYLEKENGRASLQVQLKVVEGVTQNDGSDPVGATSFTFFSLNGFETMKDKGDYVKAMFNGFTQATGVDFDPADFDPAELASDLVGLTVRGVNRVKPDRNGDPQEEWSKWKAAD